MRVNEIIQTYRSILPKFKFRFRSELSALAKVLDDRERIHHVIFAGFGHGRGLLVATGHRLLFINKEHGQIYYKSYEYSDIEEVMLKKKGMEAWLTVKSRDSVFTASSFLDGRMRLMSEFLKHKSYGFVAQKFSVVPFEWQPHSMARTRRFGRLNLLPRSAAAKQ